MHQRRSARGPALRGAALLRSSAVLITAVLVVSACSSRSAPGSPATNAGGSPLAEWRHSAAVLVSTLLTRQGASVALADTSGAARPTEAIEASAALALLGADPWVAPDARLVVRRGLLGDADADADPRFLTWVVGFLPRAPRVPSSGVRRNLMVSERTYASGSPADAAAAWFALDALRHGGATMRGPSFECRRPTTFAGAALATLTAPAGAGPCGDAAVLTRRAQGLLASRSGDLGLARMSALLDAARFLQDTGRAVPEAPVCTALLTEQGRYRIVHATFAYLACAFVDQAAGSPAAPSAAVVAALGLMARSGGRVADQSSTNPMGLLYSTQLLVDLGFDDSALAAVRTMPVYATRDAVDRVLLSLALGRVPRLTSALRRGLPPGTSGAIVVALAVRAGASCPAGWDPSPLIRHGLRHGGSADELFRVATIAMAAAQCAGTPLDPAARRDLLRWAGDAQRADARMPGSLLELWKATEARCAIGASPGLTPGRLLPLLPDLGPGAPVDEERGELSSAVRLARLVDARCPSTPWPALTAG